MKLQKLIDRLLLSHVNSNITEGNFPEEKYDTNDVSFLEMFWMFFLLFVIAFALSREVFTSVVISLSIVFVYLISRLIRGNKKTFILFNFAEQKYSYEVIDEMEIAGYRPATLRELLFWALKGWNRNLFVIALGQSVKKYGSENVPALLFHPATKETLELTQKANHWGTNERFLAVKN